MEVIYCVSIIILYFYIKILLYTIVPLLTNYSFIMMHNYYLKLLAILIVLFFNTSVTKAQIVINEVMQSNLNIIMDDWNEYPDSWVELYNAGNTPVNIQNYGLGTKSKYSSSYLLPYHMLQPKSFLIIYCDKEENGMHASFRLESGSKGNVYLFDNNGTQIDAITNMAAMPSPDVAYGRTEDGGANWNYMVTPTPGKSNNSSVSTDVILPYPLFSVEGGLYSSPFTLTLAVPDDAPEGTVLSYTLNGSEPQYNATRAQSETSVYINKTTIVKAKLFSRNGVSLISKTHSYIFHNRQATLPVVSITTDNKNFYDDKIGIYVEGTYNQYTYNYKHDWRRPINFEYFDVNDGAVLNQLCETRVMGGASREAPMKSLAIYSNKRFGTKDFSHDIFPDKPGIPIKSFMLRNSGNDFCWSHFRDAAIQLLCRRGGMDLDWQAYQPAIWYLNGNYMGIINIRERSNEDNIYSNYNKLEDLDMFENWEELKEGSWDNLNAFKEFYGKTNNTYQEWEQWMDVSEFMNMFILNTYHINLDFPGNNIVMWRPTAEGGRWRWIIKDTDFGLGLYNRDYAYNYLNFILRTGTHEENWANTWDATRLFRRLVDNTQFKDQFIDRFAVVMGDFLNNEYGGTIIDSLKQNIAYEYQYHRQRYNDYNSWLNWDEEVDNMKTWMTKRTAYMYVHLKNYFNLGSIVSVRVNTASITPSEVEIDFNENKLSRSVFKGNFYQNREIRLSGKSTNEAKQVSGWKVTKTVNGVQTTETVTGKSLTYTAPTNCTNLVIDPLLEASTGIESNQNDDWRIIKESDGIRLTDISLDAQVTLYSVNGQILFSESVDSNDMKIEISTHGTYIVKVIDGNQTKSQKIVF